MTTVSIPASPPGSGNGPTDSSGDLATGSAAVDQEIAQMNAAFALATETNIKITIAKTIDGAEETAAEQGPNIGRRKRHRVRADLHSRIETLDIF
jgi:hypothetical protein